MSEDRGSIADSAAGPLRERAGVSVIWKGPYYSGGQIDTTLQLDGDRLTVAVDQQELGPFKRAAVKRLFGETAPEELAAGRPVELAFSVGEARIRFPRKSGLLIELPGKPKFGVSFFQWSERAESGSPTAATMEAGQALLGRRGKQARQVRELWRERLERAGAHP